MSGDCTLVGGTLSLLLGSWKKDNFVGWMAADSSITWGIITELDNFVG